MALQAQRTAAVLSVLALWFILRPYPGIKGDGALYLGQALAAVSPASIGRDYMFVLDGQFGLSLFPPVAAALTARLGVSEAAMLLVFGGLLAWFAALVAVCSRMASGRLLWAALACTAVLPASYSYWFRYGEPHATPRLFAEAAVLAAVAVMLSGRRWAALPFLLLAAAMHPVMALCGFGVLFLLLCAHDRRWLWAGAVGAALILAGAAAGLPLVERLFTRIDPTWLEVIRARSRVVLPSTWPADEWGRMALQLGTVLVAATVTAGVVQRMLLAVSATAVLGVIASLVGGDLLGSALVIQAQPWRAVWLLAALTPACVALCGFALWRGDRQARLVLAALAVAWAGSSNPMGVAAPAAALALVLRIMTLRGSELKLHPAAAPLTTAAAGVLLAVFVFSEAYGVVGLLQSRPEGMPIRWSDVAPRQDLSVLLAALVLAVAALWPAKPGAGASLATAAAAIALVGGAALHWDVRTPDQTALDERKGAEALATLLQPSPGPVYWMGGVTQAWFWADRPAWFSGAQGAGVVFSRELAAEWSRRHRALADIGVEEPLKENADQSRVAQTFLTAPRARQVCALPGGPAWIVAPRQRVTPGAAELTTAYWTSPAAAYEYRVTDDQVRWSSSRTFALIDCAKFRPAAAGLRPAAS